MSDLLDVAVTSLHRPAKLSVPTAPEDPAHVLGWAFDYDDLLFTRRRNDMRTAEISFSFDDPICELLYEVYHSTVTDTDVQISTAYEVMLFLRWRGVPQLWAPIVAPMNWRSA